MKSHRLVSVRTCAIEEEVGEFWSDVCGPRWQKILDLEEESIRWEQHWKSQIIFKVCIIIYSLKVVILLVPAEIISNSLVHAILGVLRHTRRYSLSEHTNDSRIFIFACWPSVAGAVGECYIIRLWRSASWVSDLSTTLSTDQ